ncbi:C2 calcium-dependent domain-containing protein 4A-like isoform X2 [Cyclopterus lumpus]|nr:C2 calcium-dependent domain-containing protein 4A-like isoform X2 [Cyclopterus lumpus]
MSGPHKSGSSLRSRVLTPQQTSSFVIPSRSPRLHRSSPDRDQAPRRLQTRPPQSADSDPSTSAAMSLLHVGKVTTPYGFCAALAASPCSRRRESLFHQNQPDTDTNPQDLVDPPPRHGPDR